MSELLKHEEQVDENQNTQNREEIPSTDSGTTKASTPRLKGDSKKFIVGIVSLVAVIAIVFLIFYKSEFKKVQEEALEIAGMIASGKDYFFIDTYPDDYENMDASLVALLLPDTHENALEAIKYANEALGFNGSVYSKMLETSALMGRQSEETDKYRVSWTYHPDDGLEVTYEKK